MLYLETKIPLAYRAQFVAKVISICNDLDIDPNWLMLVMNSESNLNYLAVNPMGGATGLIQFMPATAAYLGTSTQALKDMGPVAQLDYVKKYFWPYRNKITRYSDLYLTTFYPYALGKSNDYVFGSESDRENTVRNYNKVIDLNNNGVITLGEFYTWSDNRIPADIRKQLSIGTQFMKKIKGNSFLVVGLVFLLLFVFLKK